MNDVPEVGDEVRVRARRCASDLGFTLVELMMVVLILGVLVMIVMPGYLQSTERAEERTCQATRVSVELADYAYYIENADWATSIDALVGTWLVRAPRCPSRGTYAWINVPTTEHPARSLGCSVHYFPVEQLTPLGSSFGEISSNMMALINAYYAANHRWPRSWAPYNFTDLGLDPADWAQPIGNIYYSPVGNRVNIKPAVGWDIAVKDATGKTLVLTAKTSWNLVYSAADGKWYYKSIDKANVVDITTMTVTQSK